MVKLIIVCHGALANGLLNAMELILGSQEEIYAFRLDEEDSIDDLEASIDRAVQERQPGQEVLILVDLFGASPFNISARVASRNSGIEVITGVNLAMLLETTLQREGNDLLELTSVAREAGRSSIKVLSDLMSQDNAQTTI
jgi:PTS system mannose-specific IIA component